MNCIDILREAGIDERAFPETVRGFGDSLINMPGTVDFLRADTLREVCEYVGMSQETTAFVLETARRITGSKALTAFTWHMYYRLVTPSFSSGCQPGGFYDFGPLEKALGKYAGAQTLIVNLAAVIQARKNYRALGCPENIVRDTLSVIKSSCDSHISQFGTPGAALQALNWMRLYVTCRLYQLGRFNFKLMETFPFGLVIRRERDGAKVMLLADGVRCNRDGFILQQDDPLASGGWTCILEDKAGSIRGNPVDPRGFALREIREFSKSEWSIALRPGDIMVDMHIPAGGKMTPEACRDSFTQVFAWFKKMNPGAFKPVIISHSWIFNTQFEQMLPDSNLAKLMRQCMLFPHDSYGRDGMFFLFGRDWPNPADAPHDTSVRRAMLSVLERGERLRCGGMLFFEEELPAFGSEPYRRMKI